MLLRLPSLLTDESASCEGWFPLAYILRFPLAYIIHKVPGGLGSLSLFGSPCPCLFPVPIIGSLSLKPAGALQG